MSIVMNIIKVTILQPCVQQKWPSKDLVTFNCAEMKNLLHCKYNCIPANTLHHCLVFCVGRGDGGLFFPFHRRWGAGAGHATAAVMGPCCVTECVLCSSLVSTLIISYCPNY